MEAPGDGAAMMKMWEGMGRVIIVDAMKIGMPAGTIHRWDVSRDPVPVGFRSNSSHAFGLGQAMEMAREMRTLPGTLILFGMEGEQFGFGTAVSRVVSNALPALVEMIVHELNGWKGA
jgi:hydrogenase maturation protease